MNSGPRPCLQCWVPPVRAPVQDSHLRSQHRAQHTRPALRASLRDDSRDTSFSDTSASATIPSHRYLDRTNTLLRGLVESGQYTRFRYTQRLADLGIAASVGSVADA